MNKYGFNNEYGTSQEYGLNFLEYPTFSYGHEKFEETEIAGRENSYMETTGSYENTVITNKMEFECESASDYESKKDSLLNWIKKSKKLTYSDRNDRYFVVKQVKFEVKRLFPCIGQVMVNFICEPFQYLVSGESEYSKSEVLNNPYGECHPIYVLSGTSNVYKLAVNGNEVEVNVVAKTYIDTNKMITYTESGMCNSRLKGDYEKLYLLEGENTIETSSSSGYTPTLKIVPRWRCL